MLSQTREESKRWGGALGMNKPLEEGAMQKQKGKKKSLSTHAAPQTRKERRKCSCSLLRWQIGVDSGCEWGEMSSGWLAELFTCREVAKLQAGPWLHGMRVPIGRCLSLQNGLSDFTLAPRRTGTMPVHLPIATGTG